MNFKSSVSAVLLFFATQSHAESVVHWGEARDSAGVVVYYEKHILTIADNRSQFSETIYYDKDMKEPIASMKSDYSSNIKLPTYEFVDFRTKYREGLRVVQGSYVAYFENPGTAESSKPLKDVDNVFSCQGWHYYLIENLALLEKQNIILKLVLPSELDYYSFTVEKVSAENDRIVANLSLSNIFLRLLVPKLRLVYDKKQRKLVEYEGVSNILDSNKKRQEVKIVYKYDTASTGGGGTFFHPAQSTASAPQ